MSSTRGDALKAWCKAALGVACVVLFSAADAQSDQEFNTDRRQFLLAQALGKISETVRLEMSRWNVPGASVAIVKEGRVIYAEGFGFRDPGLTLEVTPKTLFPLASMTKPFTALAAGIEVDDGVIGWDTPVSSRVPEFRLSDSTYTSKVSLRDMLSHRTGLEPEDALWASGELEVGDLFDRISELRAIKPLRQSFEYNNVLYIASAHLVGKLGGTDWTDVLRNRVLSRIDMKSTGFSIEEMLESNDFSHGFRYEKGVVQPNELPGPDDGLWYTSRGSGSMYSSADEMANWMIFQMGNGTFKEARIVSEELLSTTHTAQIRIENPPFYLSYPEVNDQSYALGWYVDEYRGHERLHHGGASPMGYSNYMVMFPHDQTGIVILSNRYVLMPVQLTYQFSDLVLGLKEENWRDRFAEYIE